MITQTRTHRIVFRAKHLDIQFTRLLLVEKASSAAEEFSFVHQHCTQSRHNLFVYTTSHQSICFCLHNLADDLFSPHC